MAGFCGGWSGEGVCPRLRFGAVRSVLVNRHGVLPISRVELGGVAGLPAGWRYRCMEAMSPPCRTRQERPTVKWHDPVGRVPLHSLLNRYE